MELPPVDSEAGALRECYAPALLWADAFWQGLFERMAARDAGECDLRALARALTADVIALRCLPAWPAADAALLRLVGVAAGARGLGAHDAATRQASVDILGSIAAAVCAGNQAAAEEGAALDALLRDAGARRLCQCTLMRSCGVLLVSWPTDISLKSGSSDLLV